MKYFEPRTARVLEDPLELPEAVFMLFETVIVFDHLHQVIKILSHLTVGQNGEPITKEAYARGRDHLNSIASLLTTAQPFHMPESSAMSTDKPCSMTSNCGKEGYEEMVRYLKNHIVSGDIIQAVPAQRIKRSVKAHPFQVYRQLRSLNPSPYMFYLNLSDFQVVGASPEMMCQVIDGRVVTHPIAGTRKRGKTLQEDAVMAQDLLADKKEKAEHIMLVDLGRNDVNRVCDSSSVTVDSLMHIEKYSHVMHIVSHVSGNLRPDKTPFDAFRSIFPAGTVSGAPKIRAIELIAECEKEKRGVYAGAVGYFSFSGDLDTAIAIRTTVFKDGFAYLQAGAGIVHDSDPTMEYEETMNKLRSNMVSIDRAESEFQQTQSLNSPSKSTTRKRRKQK